MYLFIYFYWLFTVTMHQPLEFISIFLEIQIKSN